MKLRMIERKKVIALTPARGGSKGLPGKNIKSFLGKPLLVHAVEIAVSSTLIDAVYVSTDCSKIAKIANEAGAEVSMRPLHLATDVALVAETVRELLINIDLSFDYMVLLEATSPHRSVELVEACLKELEKSGADSIATFSEADPPPKRLWKIVDKEASPYIADSDPWLPRQQHEPAYHLNGLVYAFNIRRFLEVQAKSIYFGKRIAIITKGKSIDIDTLEDFMLAEYMMGMKTK
jgi:CMP-N-acetylneuraminic acid synthetase